VTKRDNDTHAAGAYYDDFSVTYEHGRDMGYHRMLDDLEIDIVAPYARDADVLEIGVGTGLILGRLAPAANSVCGVDVSRGMLAAARARGLRAVLGSATALPFKDESFDVVCSFKVLAHVPDIGRALAEIARVTRPGGHMVLEFYNPWSLRYLAKLAAGPQPIGEGRTEADMYTRWDSPNVIPRLLPAGVELLDVRGVRVLTPAAAALRLPGVGKALAFGERLAASSRLRYFGGFLVALLHRKA